MQLIGKLLGLASMILAGSVAAWAQAVEPTTGEGIIQMSDLDLTKITYFDDAGKTSVRKNQTTVGSPIVLKGVTYRSGVGTHADSKAVIKINGATKFHAIAGVDDEADLAADHGVVDHTVTLYRESLNDGEVKHSARLTRENDADIATIDLDLTGYTYMVLNFDSGTQKWADHCVWADARLEYTGEAPVTVTENEMFAGTPSGIVTLPESGPAGEEIIPLSSMDLTHVVNGWGTIKKDKSIDGNPLILKGTRYASGIGMHATGQMVIQLNGTALRFHAVIGIDDEAGANGNCDYCVELRRLNGESVTVKSGSIKRSDSEPVTIDIDGLSDYKYLILDFPQGAGGNEADHVDIANAYFEWEYHNSSRPEIVAPSVLDGKLNCATRMFSQPGVRYMHKLRSSFDGLTITVRDLPAGLTFDESRCMVVGRIDTEGDYVYTAVLTTPDGETEEIPVSLTVSSTLDQPTPWMGWLSWNVVQGDISQSVVETVADAFVSQGLLDAGYNILAIDDLWHADSREADGRPRPDAAKFPRGMKAAADYVHSKGMKFGIYSDGGTHTCAGRFGSLNHETIDANTYAEWGVDLVKYDYCHNPGEDLATCKATYKAMGDALKASGRNIIFYVCEWGVREPWKWGPDVGGSCWRTTYDVRDTWIGRAPGVGFVQSMAGMKDLWPYSGVNRFNDADMLCVGINGTGKSSSDLCTGTPGMTKDEYRTQFAMWCMWSSPLALTFDPRKEISDEDKAIMTNPEMIALDQDPMGQQAEFIGQYPGDMYLFAKDLENGDVAVSVTNMGPAAGSFTIEFADIPALDREATYYVRDVQYRADLPEAKGSLATGTIRSHETKVYRLSASNGESGIDSATVTGALGRMTVTADGGKVKVCVPGTDGTDKRVLLSDIEGRVLAGCSGSGECFTLPVSAARGLYIASVTAAGRHHSAKVCL